MSHREASWSRHEDTNAYLPAPWGLIHSEYRYSSLGANLSVFSCHNVGFECVHSRTLTECNIRYIGHVVVDLFGRETGTRGATKDEILLFAHRS